MMTNMKVVWSCISPASAASSYAIASWLDADMSMKGGRRALFAPYTRMTAEVRQEGLRQRAAALHGTDRKAGAPDLQ